MLAPPPIPGSKRFDHREARLITLYMPVYKVYSVARREHDSSGGGVVGVTQLPIVTTGTDKRARLEARPEFVYNPETGDLIDKRTNEFVYNPEHPEFEQVWTFLRVWMERQWMYVKERLRPPPVHIQVCPRRLRYLNVHKQTCYRGYDKTPVCSDAVASGDVWSPKYAEELGEWCDKIKKEGFDLVLHDGRTAWSTNMITYYDYGLSTTAPAFYTVYTNALPEHTVEGALKEYGRYVTENWVGEDDVPEEFRREVFVEEKWWLLPLPIIFKMFVLLTEEEGFDPDVEDTDVWPTYTEWRASLVANAPWWHHDLR